MLQAKISSLGEMNNGLSAIETESGTQLSLSLLSFFLRVNGMIFRAEGISNVQAFLDGKADFMKAAWFVRVRALRVGMRDECQGGPDHQEGS